MLCDVKELGDWKYMLAACIALLAGSLLQSIIYPGTTEYGVLDKLGMAVAAVFIAIWVTRALLRRFVTRPDQRRE